MTDAPERPSAGAESSGMKQPGFDAIKGGILLGLAVLLGIVLLNVIDDGSDGPVGDGTTTEPTSAGGTTETSTPTATEAPAKTPAELIVIAVNAGARAGSAGNMSEQLATAGYTNQLEPADWSGEQRAGNSVLCKPNLDREAAALATAVGAGTQAAPMPTPPPPGGDQADCVVAVGGEATADTTATTGTTTG